MQRHSLPVVSHASPVPSEDTMSSSHAIAALAALGQPTRLEIFSLLMRNEPHGLAAGSLAENIGCPQNTLSTHLSILARSRLIRGVRDGRSIIYHADVDGMRALLGFLVKDCCDGHPELCNLTQVAVPGTCTCSPAIKKKSTSRK